MNEDMTAKVDAARAAVKTHLEKAHDGTVLHVILSALDLILEGPTNDAVEPAINTGAYLTGAGEVRE